MNNSQMTIGDAASQWLRTRIAESYDEFEQVFGNAYRGKTSGQRLRAVREFRDFLINGTVPEGGGKDRQDAGH